MSSHDVVVLGAGIGGLCAAKTYLELAPETDLVILEARATVGGVWSLQNLYPGIKTNNLAGTYEYSDFPLLANPKYGVTESDHIPGRTVYQYLEDYSYHFRLHERIHLHTDVTVIEKNADRTWTLTATTTSPNSSPKTTTYYCTHLIIANGLASTPRPPSLSPPPTFAPPILTHADLPNTAAALAKDPAVKTVTVVGASKIGYDAVSLFAEEGKRVEWVVRESGGGGVWMSPPWVVVMGWRVMLEKVVTTRFWTWFSPCIWGDNDGYGWIRRLLHNTRVGRWIVQKYWEGVRNDAVEGNEYRKHKELKHLEPRESLFWNPRVGIHNYANPIHNHLLSHQVTLHRADITSLSGPNTINLSNHTTLTTDVLLQITGWQLLPRIKYLPEGIEADIGIPTLNSTPSQQKKWAELNEKADEEILTKFPILNQPPEAKLQLTNLTTPFRLYRGIAPPVLTQQGDHSLAYMKMVHSTANLIIAETQALWVFAYLHHALPINTSDVMYQTALASRFGKWRYPWGFGAWWPETVYDIIPYADQILRDLGVQRWRKGGWREWGEGYTIHDYRGIIGEWKEGWEKRKGKGKTS